MSGIQTCYIMYFIIAYHCVSLSGCKCNFFPWLLLFVSFILVRMIDLEPFQVYYARVSVVAKLETITMLKKRMQLSSFDKKFLLKQIQENSQGT